MANAGTLGLEAALLARTAEGDEAAFEALFRRFERPLYAYFLRMLQDRSTAEDLVCATLTAVWKGAPGFRGESHVSTWVFAIAHRLGTAAAHRRRPTVSLDEIEETAAGNGPEEVGERTDIAIRTRAAVARLSREHREVMELTFYHGFSYSDIARILGIPVGTVKTRMFYARQKLRAILKDAGITDVT